MKCVGKFKFKGLVKREGGSFTNDKGQEINYNASYLLKVDESTENGIYERGFKVADDSSLVPSLLQLKPYQDITLEFDVILYNSSIKLVPIAIKNSDK